MSSKTFPSAVEAIHAFEVAEREARRQLEKRVVTLEAQVRSIQMALPKGIQHAEARDE